MRLKTRPGPSSFSSSLHFNPPESFPFLDVKLFFRLCFISLFPARGLFLTCQQQWELPRRCQQGQRWSPARSQEPPAPGDTALHFHSKAPHCCFAAFEEFSLFPEKFKVLGVISCPPGREPPMALGGLHPLPQSSVGVWGDTETSGKCHKVATSSISSLATFAHLTLENIQVGGWVRAPSPGPCGGSAPQFGAITSKRRGQNPEGQGDTRHPSSRGSVGVKISTHPSGSLRNFTGLEPVLGPSSHSVEMN